MATQTNARSSSAKSPSVIRQSNTIEKCNSTSSGWYVVNSAATSRGGAGGGVPGAAVEFRGRQSRRGSARGCVCSSSVGRQLVPETHRRQAHPVCLELQHIGATEWPTWASYLDPAITRPYRPFWMYHRRSFAATSPENLLRMPSSVKIHSSTEKIVSENKPPYGGAAAAQWALHFCFGGIPTSIYVASSVGRNLLIRLLAIFLPLLALSFVALWCVAAIVL